MITRRMLLAAPVAAPFLPRRSRADGLKPVNADGLKPVHIGQAAPAVSFLPIQAARALGAFAPAGLDLFWVALPGGDPACLAALQSGDIEFAAVGSAAVLGAIGKGQPLQMVASLMSKVPLELVCSNAAIERSGLSVADDPVQKRLSILKGATIGVSAQGGAQERAARWLARQAGLDPREVQVVVAGPPPAIQAALEAGRIDGFVLSPPEGLLAEDARTGQVVVRMGDEFPALKDVPSLVLAVRTPVRDETRALLVDTCRAMIAASTQLLANPIAVAGTIQEKLYPRMKGPVMTAAIQSLKGGIVGRGRFDPAGVAALVSYAGEAGGRGAAEGGFWTNAYWQAAAQ